MTLVSELACEVIAGPLEIPPVKALRNLVIWNVLCIFEVFLEVLSLRKNFSKLRVIFVEWFLVLAVEFDKVVVLGVGLGQR